VRGLRGVHRARCATFDPTRPKQFRPTNHPGHPSITTSRFCYKFVLYIFPWQRSALGRPRMPAVEHFMCKFIWQFGRAHTHGGVNPIAERVCVLLIKVLDASNPCRDAYKLTFLPASPKVKPKLFKKEISPIARLFIVRMFFARNGAPQ